MTVHCFRKLWAFGTSFVYTYLLGNLGILTIFLCLSSGKDTALDLKPPLLRDTF